MTLIDVLICFGWAACIWFIIRFVQVSHEADEEIEQMTEDREDRK